jgi:hypothetical protein
LSKLLFRFKQMTSQSLGGTDAIISVALASSGSYSTINVTLLKQGSSYLVGDVFVFLGSQLSGVNPANNLTFTVSSINTTGGILTYSVSGTGAAVTSTTLNVPTGQSLQYSYTRDASDITRALKERTIYNEKRSGSLITSGKGGSLILGRPGVNPGAENNLPAGNGQRLWIPHGNQYRLSFLFGRLKCGDCSGGAFNLPGPISRPLM